MKLKIAVGAMALFSSCVMADDSLPLAPVSDDPPLPVPRGTLTQMVDAWSYPQFQMESGPDRSFRSVWVRLFPLLSVPLGDPYPETQNRNLISLSCEGGLQIFSLATNRLLARAQETMSLDFARALYFFDGRSGRLEPLWVTCRDPEKLAVAIWDQNRKLPGGKSAEVRLQVRGGLVANKTLYKSKGLPEVLLWSVINVLPVNEYLLSVVPSEVISSWNLETLKSQAVAARSYGMYEIAAARAERRDYDVDPSTWFQSYRGVQFWDRQQNIWQQVELPSTSMAVGLTRGEVLTFQNEIIKAYFSSNSGGRTCTTSECFESGYDAPYIRAVNDHPRVRSSPGGTWGNLANLTSNAIRARLAGSGAVIPAPVRRLEHLERGPSRRTWRLRVLMTNGKRVDLDRVQTRRLMGLFGPIRSFFYELLSGNANTGKQGLRGHGYGHAIGLSQWGAELFARDGWKAPQILRHYYYGVQIQDLSNRGMPQDVEPGTELGILPLPGLKN